MKTYSFICRALRAALLIVFTFSAINSTVQANSSAADYDKQISDLIRKSRCEDAARLVGSARNKNESLAALPRWYYQLIECAGGDFGTYGVSIIEYYDRELRKLTDRKACREAEELVKRIDERYKRLQSGIGYMRWSFEVARCFEGVDRPKSAALYRNVITQFAGTDVARSAQGRLNYLLGDRSWVFDRPEMVGEGVANALRNRDFNQLGRYASRSSFFFGHEEDVRPIDYGRDLRPMLEKVLEKSAARYFGVREVGPAKRHLVVEFRAEMLPCWFFSFENLDGGWQWTGVIVSNLVTRENANWSNEFVCDHPHLR